MSKGNLFIVLEGIDHSGKSTLAKLLANQLGYTYICFPNRTTKIGGILNAFLQENKEYTVDELDALDDEIWRLIDELNLDKSPFKAFVNEEAGESEFFRSQRLNKYIIILFCLNRYEKAEWIKRELKQNGVVCDRYWISGAAVASCKGFEWESVKKLEKQLPQADLTFFLDVSPVETVKRAGFGDETHDIVEFQQHFYDKYRSIDEEMIYIRNGSIQGQLDQMIFFIEEFKSQSRENNTNK
ncbi:KTHY [Enterospora canceri]|uniref:KTHY n=1 Tax=Enterospora canceri TaxID=1081671 RepID=A0A1Y1S7R9_9MICR|nr:KTHY [Enterospora canceri]